MCAVAQRQRGLPSVATPFSVQVVKEPSAGQIEIVIDGRQIGRFNLFSPNTVTDTLSFNGLGNGGHLIQISSYNGNASLDTFTTPGTAPFYTPIAPTGIIRYEEDDPQVQYNGAPYSTAPQSWVQSTYGFNSGGHYVHTET